MKGVRRSVAWVTVLLVLLPMGIHSAGAQTTGSWQTLAPLSVKRDEAAYVSLDGKFHLIGRLLAHHVYDPATDSWSTKKALPEKIHHVQGVTVGGKIYFIGGLTGWPSPNVNSVYIYDPNTNNWTLGAPMPRGRGAGGIAVHNGRIYYAGGINNGIAVPWFDVYDPVANTWTQLPDMPRVREHFHAAVVNGKFYAIGGRNIQFNSFVTQTDAFDLATGQWQTGLAPIPTARGGFGVGVSGTEIIVFGGEGNGEAKAAVEAYDTSTNTWRSLTPMPVPRHGIEVAECDGGFYIAGGSTDQGGGHQSTVHDVFFPGGGPTACGQGAPPPPPTQIGFGKSVLNRNESGGTAFAQPTTLQFGPDGRLYVGLLNGTIKIYVVSRNAANNYSATLVDQILSVKNIQNHDDDGTPNSTCPALCKRLMTGILVTGTANNPVIYATSSDPRIGGGAEGEDLNLDTNSGTLSQLTWTGSAWQHTILVRGLPRSEENHASNGMALDTATNTLYIAQGGHTNKGAPSHNFALLPEYALSAAILKVNLAAITNPPYDIPTLDDEDRPGSPDANDPFGGSDGKNQARIVPGGPVQVYASGFRNAYDVVITTSGRTYTVDNGPNGGWGDIPINEGPGGTCTNGVNDPGTANPDVLHLVTPGYYGGHPNPTRGNMANTFNASNPQSPVSLSNPIECDYQHFKQGGPGLAQLSNSSNGIDEYTSGNFGGTMTGDLIIAGYTKNEVERVKLNASGDQVVINETLFATVGTHPLDVEALGSGDPFPGTIFVADIATNSIYVFEPNDFSGGGGGGCTGADDPSLDEDGDGYNNADEIDNGTNPCSAADVPPDADGDGLSDLNDPDDDNDGVSDINDPFAIDPNDGLATQIPIEYSWENDGPSPGGLLNTGFTGLMTNGGDDYLTLFDQANMVVGGAAGVTTVASVPEGDAFKAKNSQQYGFQFGVMPISTTFTVQTRIVAPFAGLTPQDSQSMGMFIGDGTQSNYVKIIVRANNGGGVQRLVEMADAVIVQKSLSLALPGPDYVDLFLTVNPSKGFVLGSYQATSGGVPGPRVNVGAGTSIPSTWYDGNRALAVGMISTSTGPGPVFPATWDFMRVYEGT